MKKQTMYNHLQKQYVKLNQRIQKAMQTGRFYAYTQFKQQQLLSRLKRCSFQLKQLGAGVAVVAALGMATPAVGQDTFFIEPNATANVYDNSFRQQKMQFVDIDGDGDLDIFADSLYQDIAYLNKILYYENIGTSTSPSFVQRYGTNNPLNLAANPQKPTFVDIDGDGDLDCFSGYRYGYINTTTYTYGSLAYYENQGSSTAPDFVLQTGINNPLDTLNTLITDENPVFVDIDNDGDQDFFSIGTNTQREILFYENIGTSSNPNFLQRLGNANVLEVINDTIRNASGGFFDHDLQFADMDLDGDQDAFVIGDFNSSNGIDYFRYFENTGTATSPSFAISSTSPLDLISMMDSSTFFRLVDIDNDGDLDVYSIEKLNLQVFIVESVFYENQRIFNNLLDIREEELLTIYPNPTSGIIYFDQPITGESKIYDINGREVFTEKLWEGKEINISTLSNGVYFLAIDSPIENFRAKIIVQK